MMAGGTTAENMRRTDLAAMAGAAAAAFFFGISTPLSKTLAGGMNAFALAGLLYLGAGIGLALLEPFKKREPAPSAGKLNYKYILGMVLFGGLLGPVFLMLAIGLAPAASISIWLNIELAATALLGHFLFKDHLNRLGWASVALTLVAGVMLSWGSGAAGFRAGVLVALACFAWGLDNHFTALIDGLSPSRSTIIKGLTAGTTNLLIGMALAGGLPPLQASGKAMLTGFFCYGLSITLYISSAQKLGAVRSQLIFSVAPVFGVLLSVLSLGESLSTVQMVSGTLLFASVWIMLAERHRHHHAHSEMEHAHQHSHDDLHHGHPHAENPAGPHSHFHRHEKTGHDHPHWPDLHHRHGH